MMIFILCVCIRYAFVGETLKTSGDTGETRGECFGDRRRHVVKSAIFDLFPSGSTSHH